MSNINTTNVFLNKNGVKIGEITDYSVQGISRRVYMSYRKPNHFFIKFNGFGIDAGILKQLLDKRIEVIVIDYMGKTGHRHFFSLIDDWYKYGVIVQYTTEYDSDKMASYGRQYILSKKHMYDRFMTGYTTICQRCGERPKKRIPNTKNERYRYCWSCMDYLRNHEQRTVFDVYRSS